MILIKYNSKKIMKKSTIFLLLLLLSSCIAKTKMSLSSSYKNEFILNKNKTLLFKPF